MKTFKVDFCLLISLLLFGIYSTGDGMRRDRCYRGPGNQIISSDNDGGSNCIECMGRNNVIIIQFAKLQCEDYDETEGDANQGAFPSTTVTLFAASELNRTCCGMKECDLDGIMQNTLLQGDNFCGDEDVELFFNFTCVDVGGGPMRERRRNEAITQCFGNNFPRSPDIDPSTTQPITTEKTTTSPTTKETATTQNLRISTTTASSSIRTEDYTSDTETSFIGLDRNTSQATSLNSTEINGALSAVNSTWLPAIIASVFFLLSMVIMSYVLFRKKKCIKSCCKGETENIDKMVLNHPAASGLHNQQPSTPAQYEEIDMCKQSVSNILYETKETPPKTKYDQLWSSSNQPNNPQATNYNNRFATLENKGTEDDAKNQNNRLYEMANEVSGNNFAKDHQNNDVDDSQTEKTTVYNDLYSFQKQ